ncbi:MAG TPA: DUF2851 family protein [Candidatus Kapabacteria bacterium]|nr:DUF2851 family protein [Candidatus Kapabacteria bacterium]
MKPGSEQELYALWERSALTGIILRGTRGERIHIVSRGERNAGAGPDYNGAVLLLNGELVVGAVEMHLHEREWFAHGHHHDPAYADVVLHVVLHGDGTGGPGLPTLLCDALRTVAASAPTGAAGAGAAERGGAERDGAMEGPQGAGSTVPEVLAPVLVAELAWARLLRRATQIIRAEPDYPNADRVRRAFLRRVFDALGYGGDRDAMGTVCETVLSQEAELASASFDEIAARVFAAAALAPERVAASAREFMSESRLQRILNNHDLPRKSISWQYGTRPANAPERRLWGGVRIVFDTYHRTLLDRLFRDLRNESVRDARQIFQVRMGREVMVGSSRAYDMLINAALPAALAAGLLSGDVVLVTATCRLYRTAPSAGSNAIVRAVERRFALGHTIGGAFWQQGAIEFHQRYLTPDRSRLSFVAEPHEPDRRRRT